MSDYPGIGKKGEKVVAHNINRWIADKQGVESESFGGMGTGKLLAFWDHKAKKIRQCGVDSGGTSCEWLIWKENDRWVFQGGETLPDGSRTEGKGAAIVQDGGKTLVYEGEFTLNGKKLPPLHDVFRRAEQ